MKKFDLIFCLYAVAVVTVIATFFVGGVGAAVLLCLCAVAMDTAVVLNIIRRVRAKKPVLRWSVPMVGLALCATLMAIIQIRDLILY